MKYLLNKINLFNIMQFITLSMLILQFITMIYFIYNGISFSIRGIDF